MYSRHVICFYAMIFYDSLLPCVFKWILLFIVNTHRWGVEG